MKKLLTISLAMAMTSPVLAAGKPGKPEAPGKTGVEARRAAEKVRNEGRTGIEAEISKRSGKESTEIDSGLDSFSKYNRNTNRDYYTAKEGLLKHFPEAQVKKSLEEDNKAYEAAFEAVRNEKDAELKKEKKDAFNDAMEVTSRLEELGMGMNAADMAIINNYLKILGLNIESIMKSDDIQVVQNFKAMVKAIGKHATSRGLSAEQLQKDIDTEYYMAINGGKKPTEKELKELREKREQFCKRGALA